MPKEKSPKTVSVTKKATPVKKAPVTKQAAEPVVKRAPITQVTGGKGRVLVGKVLSNKMTKTVVVEVSRFKAHPLYHKRMRHSKGIHAHDELGAVKDQWVEITECRPISKTKSFVVTKIILKK